MAALPWLLLTGLGLTANFLSSSILIAVSVSLETMRTLEGELAIRGIESGKNNGFM